MLGRGRVPAGSLPALPLLVVFVALLCIVLARTPLRVGVEPRVPKASGTHVVSLPGSCFDLHRPRLKVHLAIEALPLGLPSVVEAVVTMATALPVGDEASTAGLLPGSIHAVHGIWRPRSTRALVCPWLTRPNTKHGNTRHYNVLQIPEYHATSCRTTRDNAIPRTAVQCKAMPGHAMQHSALQCNTFHHTAERMQTLRQNTAIACNTVPC